MIDSKTKLQTVWKRYILKWDNELAAKLMQSILFILIFFVFESTIEDWLNQYWVEPILLNIQSPTTVIVMLLCVVISHSIYQVNSKNFSLKSYEIFLLFFFAKYRYFDQVWSFYPLTSNIKLIDLFPIGLVLPKFIAFARFYADFKLDTPEIGIIDPDIPLSDTNPIDELDRNKFALDLVEVLKVTRPSKRALAIGINGSWGSGKTSLSYLITRLLREDSTKDNFYHIHFDPWLHSQGKSLTHTFLKIVKDIIGTDQYVISKAIDQYAKNFLENTESMIFKSQVIKELNSQNTLEDELELLKSNIRNLRKTLLVTVDDLDRLSGEEIIEVLRLIRLVGDFPNTIYIVLYDREYIKSVIHEKLNEHNSDIYLDKIIQVEYTIPEGNIDDLRQYLAKRISQAMNLAIKQDKLYWTDDNINEMTRIKQLNHFIRHLRDIKRFTNNFILRYRIIYENVNFKQFFLIELLRYRHPELITILYNNREICLAQFAMERSFTSTEFPENHEFWDLVYKNENAREILRLIASYKTEAHSISEPFYFDNYFTLSLLPNYISETEFNTVINSDLDATSNKYRIWVNDNKNMLVYRFRNYAVADIDTFIKYASHLENALNILMKDERVNAGDSWIDLPKIFINKYLKLSADINLDQKELYQKVTTWLFDPKHNHNESIKNIFRSNISFLVKVDFEGNPLDHNWQEAEGRSVSHLSNIFKYASDSRGKYLFFDAPFDFRFDFDFEYAPSFLRNAQIEIITSKKEYAFYIKLEVLDGSNHTKAFFRILETQSINSKISTNEYGIGIKPVSVENQRKLFELNLEEIFNRTFGHDGFVLESICGIAVRGEIGISKFRLY